MTDTHSHLLPAQPAAIPVEASPPLPLQRQLSIGSASDPLEAEADAMAAHVLGGRPAGATAGSATPKLRRQAANAIQPVQAPPIVHQALNSPGQPLDSATAAFMQPRFGSDLGGVRIHNGPQAAEAAEAVQANAYTVGQDIVFGAGRYKPNSHEGKRLLAHELSHTVQQSGGGAGARLSKAPRGVYRDGPANAPKGTTTDTDTKKPKTEQVTVPIPPNFAQLVLPSLAPPQSLPALGHPGASLFQPPSQYSPTTPSLLPPAAQYTPFTPSPLAPTAPLSPSLTPAGSSGGSASAAAPKAPDRVSIHDFGPLSIGVRIGFPDLSKDTKPGDPPSALQEAIKRGEILNFIINKQPPPEYSLDPAKVVGAAWGIFSTQIAPDVARKIAAGLSSKPNAGGPTFQFDATILLDLGGAKKGGGAGGTLTVNF